MPKGGARARSGPPPDPNALRRARDKGDWVLLPAAGRDGAPPEWPLLKPSRRESELWSALWAKPQALMWERHGQEIEVALYVRNLAVAERSGATVAQGTLVRQMADSLGLTTPGLRANRWRIEAAAPVAEESAPSAPQRPSSRSRLKVVRDDSPAG
ncbi:hypothetical protein [Actinomadura gamaensis]|uniref:Terminase small subunit n=1 Tax=Actinomadura gamaensis TaxID=1763541 RepID=A0ABV9U9I1_9ACTN